MSPRSGSSTLAAPNALDRSLQPIEVEEAGRSGPDANEGCSRWDSLLRREYRRRKRQVVKDRAPRTRRGASHQPSRETAPARRRRVDRCGWRCGQGARSCLRRPTGESPAGKSFHGAASSCTPPSTTSRATRSWNARCSSPGVIEEMTCATEARSRCRRSATALTACRKSPPRNRLVKSRTAGPRASTLESVTRCRLRHIQIKSLRTEIVEELVLGWIQ